MQAAELRHVIDIQQKVAAGDGFTWSLYKRVRASIKPLSAREFIGQDQTLGGAESVVRIWYIDGIDPTMRIKHGTVIYNILGVLPDDRSGREWITMPVSRGSNEG
jgi:head-tail adaptor